jgi:hypothetical protein
MTARSALIATYRKLVAVAEHELEQAIAECIAAGVDPEEGTSVSRESLAIARTLLAEAEALPTDITPEELEQRRLVRRQLANAVDWAAS